MSAIRALIQSNFGTADTNLLNHLDAWSYGGWLRRTVAGETVSPDRAMTLSAYFDAIRVISEDVAKLPVTERRPRRDRGSDPVEDSATAYALNIEMNPELSGPAGRELLTSWALGWGAGYAEIAWSPDRRTLHLWPIHPSRVLPRRRRDTNALYYEVWSDDAGAGYGKVEFGPDELFVMRGFGDEVSGYSVARLAAESLGVSLAAQKFGAEFFGNDATPGVLISFQAPLNDKQTKILRESWMEMYGGRGRRHGPAIAGQGARIERISIPPEEAQFLETRQFQVEEICRWFRLNPNKLQHWLRTTYNNVEAANIDHVNDTMMPWVLRWEVEVDRKLLRRRFTGHYLKHNVRALLRGDLAAQSQFLKEMILNGVYSQDDAREWLDDNPLPDGKGDGYYMQQQMIELGALRFGGTFAADNKNTDDDRPLNRGPENEALAKQLLSAQEPAALAVVRRFAMKESKAKAAAEKKGQSDERAAYMGRFYLNHWPQFEEALFPSFRSMYQTACIALDVNCGEPDETDKLSSVMRVIVEDARNGGPSEKIVEEMSNWALRMAKTRKENRGGN